MRVEPGAGGYLRLRVRVVALAGCIASRALLPGDRVCPGVVPWWVAGLLCGSPRVRGSRASPVLARRLQVHYDSWEGRSARGRGLPPAGSVASRVGGGRGGPGVRAVCREGSHGRLAALCVCGAVVRRPFGSQAISLCPCRGCSVDGGLPPVRLSRVRVGRVRVRPQPWSGW